MSDLTELIKAERSAADLNGYYEGGNGTGADYNNAKAATDAAIANLAALSPAPLTINRDVIAQIVSRYVEPNPPFVNGYLVADAVISHLSAQTVEGEVECSHPYSRIKFDGGARAVVCDSCSRIVSHLGADS